MLSPDLLHPYQRKAVKFIEDREHCALWLGLGLGKSIITLTALERLVNSMDVRKVLIVAPLRVCNSVWAQEAKKWVHTHGLRISVCTGSAHARNKALMQDADIFVINRENVTWLVDRYKKAERWPFDCLVIDEASSFKSSTAKRWRALRKVRPYIQRSIQLTGTPSPNGLVDLWPQVYLLDLGERLGRTKKAYLDRFFESDFWGYKYFPRKGSEKIIHGLLSDIVLSLQTEDYLDLPKRMNSIVKVYPSGAVMDQYKALEKDFLLTLDDADIEAMSAAALANKLLQFSNGALYDECKKFSVVHDLKIDALKDLVEDNAGENILVAYNFKSDLARIKKAIPQAVALDKDPATIDKWNRGEIPLLLVHPASAGHGLNLQAGGRVVVWFGLNWSLELYEQLNGRLHRQGQERPVRVIHLVADGMLDEKVMQAVEGKASTQRELLTALKKEFTE
jgi:SNF2 family DNA or RNA helicase